MWNQIDMSPLLVSLLERAPKQSKQIIEPILLQQILASQNLCITKISVIWNSEQCGSVFEKKGVNIFSLAGLLASLNLRLASLRIYRPFKTQWFCILLSPCFTEGVGKRVLWWVHQCFLSFIDLYYVFLKRYFFTLPWVSDHSSMQRTEIL